MELLMEMRKKWVTMRAAGKVTDGQRSHRYFILHSFFLYIISIFPCTLRLSFRSFHLRATAFQKSLVPCPFQQMPGPHTPKHIHTFTSAICNVPFSIKVSRGVFPWSLSPSFSHEISTEVPPFTRQYSCAVAPRDTVWLAGPWRMIGGIRPEGPASLSEEEAEYYVRGVILLPIRSQCKKVKTDR